MNTLQLKEPKNVAILTILGLVFASIMTFYLLNILPIELRVGVERFEVIMRYAIFSLPLITNFNRIYEWLPTNKKIRFTLAILKMRIAPYIIFTGLYFFVLRPIKDIFYSLQPEKNLILFPYIVTWLGCVFLLGYFIWSNRFIMKFQHEKDLATDNPKNINDLDEKENFQDKANQTLLDVSEPDFLVDNINSIPIEVYQDVSLDTLENIIQSNEDNLDGSDFIPIETEDIHSETSVLPLNGDILNENTESLLKLKVFSDEEIEELISKIIDKIHPSSIDDLKTFLKGGKPLNKIKWVSLGSRSRGIKYIDLFYFLHPIIDSELKTFDGEERKTLIKLITENFVTYHKEITKEIDFKNANNRYTDYINEH